jgi:hypothetical protein
MSEYAIKRNLEVLQKEHAQYGLPEIVDFTPVEQNVTPGGRHADFVVMMRSDVGIVEVPLEVKSSDYCAQIYKKKCRRHDWGEIPTIVAYPRERILDYCQELIMRLAKELIAGFKAKRRQLCDHIARRRNPSLKKHHVRDDVPRMVRIHPARIHFGY